MPRTSKRTATPAPEQSPLRPVVSHPPSTWLAVIKEEIVGAGLPHDTAGLIARRILSRLVPQGVRLEMLDQRGERFQIDD